MMQGKKRQPQEQLVTRNQESSSERQELGQRRRKCPEKAYPATDGILASTTGLSNSRRRRSSSLCPESEYRRSFRSAAAVARSPVVVTTGSSAVTPSSTPMTRSASAVPDLMRSYPVSEYVSSFRSFDEYVYVDDVRGFQSVTNSCTDGGGQSVVRSWLDQVKERKSCAVSFNMRSACGSMSESLSRVYRDSTPGRREDRAIIALCLATHRLVARDKRLERERIQSRGRRQLAAKNSIPTSVRNNGSSSKKTSAGATAAAASTTTPTKPGAGKPVPVNRVSKSKSTTGGGEAGVVAPDVIPVTSESKEPAKVTPNHDSTDVDTNSDLSSY